MNIFALHPDPAIAASMHCDQHLHKMILESAQMLSTAMWHWWPDSRPFIYKPAYEKHPCTQWVCASKSNAWWITSLMFQLNEIRLDTGAQVDHSSLEISNVFHHYVDAYEEVNIPTSAHQFIFAGPDQFRLRPDLNIHRKYQQYYIQKFHLWLDKRQPMSYKGRPLPEFLLPYKDSIPHGN